MALWQRSCGLALLLNLSAALCGAQQVYDLTGTWTDDVGGRYQIRQVGRNVAWYDDRSPVVINVFSGVVTGDSIEGQWWDLPGGQLMGSGRLLLRIESNDRLVKTGSDPDYGGTIVTRNVSGGATPGPAVCTPAGAWSWVDGATTTLHSDGTVTSTTGSSARWQHIDGSHVRLTWDNGSVDTMTLGPGGQSMTGTNSAGREISVTCNTPGAGQPVRGEPPSGPFACVPVGTWAWIDNAITVIRPDGTVTSTTGSSARWRHIDGGRVRLTWDNGSVDTLALGPGPQSMTGTNSAGRVIAVNCTSPSTGASPAAGSGQGGSICADPRTQVLMDQWLAAANPPDNTRPGWSVRYDSWGRLVGRTPSSTISGLPQGVDTPLTRCDYLWAGADRLMSTNLGTLRQYVEQNRR